MLLSAEKSINIPMYVPYHGNYYTLFNKVLKYSTYK